MFHAMKSRARGVRTMGSREVAHFSGVMLRGGLSGEMPLSRDLMKKGKKPCVSVCFLLL